MLHCASVRISLEGAVQQLVALLDGTEYLTDTAVFAADVRARLALGGICVGNGLAIPHAKSTAVQKLQLAALTLDPPLPLRHTGRPAAADAGDDCRPRRGQ